MNTFPDGLNQPAHKPVIRYMPGIMPTPAQVTLLQRAFTQHEQVFVEKAFPAGYSGAVTYFVSSPNHAPVVVKLAPSFDLQREYVAYHQLVTTTSPQNTARVQGELLLHEDGQFGLLTYTFAGGDSRLPTNSLQAYYAAKGGQSTAAVLDRIFRTYGKQWWADNQLTRLVTGEEYDRLLPVHFYLAATPKPEEEVPILQAGKIDAALIRSLRPGQIVQLQGFEVTRARPGLLNLRAQPPAGERSAPLRLVWEGDFSDPYRPGNVVESLYAQIKATRLTLLAQLADQLVPGFHLDDDHFTVGDALYINPLCYLDQLLAQPYDARVSIIHGDLNLQNILVDEATGFAWLIDFADTRRGPALFDLQRLEVQLITRLLPLAMRQTHFSLTTLVTVMEALHSAYPSSTAPINSLQEPYTVMVTVRRLARHYLVNDQDWTEYYRGLTLALIGALRFEELDTQARGLALVGAATALRLLNTPLAEPFPSGQAITQPPAPGQPPFKGLQYFDVGDADLFYGRELLTANLVAHLHKHHFLVIVGASGSGKSSLVRAGLIPALQRCQPLADGKRPPPGSEYWPIHVITPTANPLQSLALSLTRDSQSVMATATLIDDLAKDARSLGLYVSKLLASNSGGVNASKHLLLVVDQFEELFTLCRSREEQKAFVDNLLNAVASPFTPSRGGERPTIVVITLRADFYANCAEFDHLRAALESHQKYIGAMNRDELRCAIKEPAQRNDWDFEPGLIELLLDDVGDEPGALPLLSHALLETWKRRQGRTLTFAGYAAAGRVQGAIAQTAERVFHQELLPEQRTIARNIFLRLTELGEGTQDTRRRVTLSELIPHSAEAPAVESVLGMLVDARLVTMFAGEAEVAHEALIREWPQLREWLADDREGLRIHRRLTEAAQEWLALNRDPGSLLRGVRLEQTLTWAQDHADQLNELEQTFLTVSHEAVEQARQEQETAQRRELEQAQTLAKSQQERAEEQAKAAADLRSRNIYLRLASVLALLLAVAASWFGLRSTQNANLAALRAAEAIQERATAEAASLEAANQQAIAQGQAAIARRAEQSAEAAAIAETEQRRQAEAQRLIAQQQVLLARVASFADQSILVTHDQLERANNTPLLLARAAVLTTWLTDTQTITQPFVTAVADKALRLAIDTAPPWRMTLPNHRHTSSIWGIAFSPDGKTIATASTDNTVRLWDTATGQQMRSFDHPDMVKTVEFSPDGQTIATGSSDNLIYLWDVATGQEIRYFAGHTDEPKSVSFSPDGRFLVSANTDRTARIWEVATGQEIQQFIGHTADVLAAAFSPDGRWIVTASTDRSVRLWDAATGDEIRTFAGHTDSVSAVAFHPNGEQIVTGSLDQTVRLWDVASGEQIRQFDGHTGKVRWVAFSPDGKTIVSSAADKTARLWDAATGQQLYSLEGHKSGVLHVAFSYDGRSIVTGSDDRMIRLWDAKTGKEIPHFAGHAGAVLSAAFSPDGKLIASAGEDHSARLWDAQQGHEIRRLENHTDTVKSASFSPSGQLIVTASADHTARLWDVATGQERRTFQGHTAAVTAAAFSPDGKTIVTASADQTVRLWDVATGQEQRTFQGHTDVVNSAAFSADGQLIVTASDDQTIRIWDVTAGNTLSTLVGHTGPVKSAVFSHDGKKVISASLDWSARVWSVSTAKEVLRLDGHTDAAWFATFSPDDQAAITAGADWTLRIWDVSMQHAPQVLALETGRLRSAVFSPDGKTIATGGEDQSIHLWKLATSEEIRRLEGHTDEIYTVRYSPNGRTLVSASKDGMIHLWDVATGTLLNTLDAQAGEVYGADFSIDGKTVVSAHRDGAARLWDAATGQLLRALVGHAAWVNSAVFSSDDRFIITASKDWTARLWDVATGTEIRRFEGHTEEVRSAAFSPDGKLIVTASRDRTACIWEVNTGHQIGCYAHLHDLELAKFSPDGQLVVTTGGDGTIYVWSIATGVAIRQLDGHTAEVDSVVFSLDGKTILTSSFDGTVRLWVVKIEDLLGLAQTLIQREPPFFTAVERGRFGIEE